MQHTTTSTAHALPVKGLDALVRAVASALAKVTRVSGAGAFWVDGGAPLWGAWVEPSRHGGGAWVIRLGRLELVADWRG